VTREKTSKGAEEQGSGGAPVTPAPLRSRTPALFFAIAFGLLALAALVRFGIAPRLNELPANYARETHFAAESRFRETPNGEWAPITLIARRVDQTIVAVGEISIVQGDLHWTTEAGQVLFESTGLYGVDRRTRMNMSGYGDIERTGQFLFPPSSARADFQFWDPMFIGLRTATFDHVDTLEGLVVYVFHFSGAKMDETAGYDYLPGVPERYRTLTDGQGTLWIEPVSGVLVDYAEQGISYFVAVKTGERVANFYEWNDRYTLETKAAQLALARSARLRILALERWLPGGLAALGLIGLAVGWSSGRMVKRTA